MVRLRALIAAAVPRDAALGALLGLALLIDAQLCPDGRGISPAGVAAAALTCGPLAWRGARPKTVLAVVVVGVFASLSTLKPVDTIVLPPMLAVYTVALSGHRMRSLLTGAFGVGVALVGVASAAGGMRTAIYNAALMALAVVAGDAVRSRRENRAAAAEREAERDAEREREAARRLADERLRIAREVHDVVAHAMVAINVQAGVAAHLLDDSSERARDALVEIKRVSGTALGDLRSTLGLLRGDQDGDAPVRPAELIDQLPGLAAPLRSAGVEVDVRIAPDTSAVPTAVGTAAYRIVQEALTNVLRHSGARHAAVQLETADGVLAIDVRDDGSAPVTAGVRRDVPAGSGNGLRGMGERAAAINGTLDAGPDPSGGWRVRARLPLR